MTQSTKNILLVAQTNLDKKDSGVWNKIHNQALALKTLFDEVTLVCYKDDSIVARTINSETEIDTVIGKKHFFHRKILFWTSLNRFIKTKQFSYAYIRYPVIDIFVIKALKSLHNNNTKIIMEIPTYPLEKEHAKGWLKVAYCIDSIMHNRCAKYVNKIVFIGNKCEKIFNCKAQQIPNGLNMNNSMSISGFKVYNNKIRLIAVSTMQIWHGYDRIIKGLSDYYSKDYTEYEVELVLVGDGPYMNQYKELVKQYKLDNHVIFTGRLCGKEIENEYEKATVGIGSLALYKDNLTIGSTLKTKEYLQRGLPFVYGCEEIDFPTDYPYSLLVPNDSSPINITQIIRFILPLLPRSEVVSKTMNQYASKHFKWEKIFESVFDNIEQ